MHAQIRFHNAQLQYWVDEFPVLEKLESKTEITQTPTAHKAPQTCFCTKAAIEVHLHRHASSYALLGLEYQPNESGVASIEIDYVTSNEKPYQGDLISLYRHQYVGLAKEYSAAIARAITNHPKLASGHYKVPIAAHCLVGSSPAIFSIAATILLDVILGQPEQGDVDGLIKDLFVKHF